jgi:hypothetical protein
LLNFAGMTPTSAPQHILTSIPATQPGSEAAREHPVISKLVSVEMTALTWRIATMLALATNMVHAMVTVDGVPPPRPNEGDTRFDAVGAIGITRRMTAEHSEASGWTDTWYGNATLIAPQLVAVARHVIHDGGSHFEPSHWKLDTPGNYAVRFRRLPDGSLRELSIPNPDYHPDIPGSTQRLYPYTVKVVAWILPAPSNPENITTMPDMLVGILEHPVTHIKPIPVGFPAEFQADFPFTLAGWGSQSPNYLSGSPRNSLRLARITGLRSPFEHSWPTPWPDTNQPATRPGPNLYDSGGAVLQEDADDNLHYLGCISMVWNGCSTTRFAGTKLGNALAGIIPEYTVNYTSGAGGQITGPVSQQVPHGGLGQTVTAVPDPNHHFLRWSDHLVVAARREESTVITTATDSYHPVRNRGITDHLAVTAFFAETKPHYHVTFQTDGTPGATLTGGNPVVLSVDHDASSPSVRAFPPDNHSFVEWSWPGGNRSTTNPITIPNVREDMTVTAHFRKQPYYAYYMPDPSWRGWIDGNSEQEVMPGQDAQPVTAVARYFARFTGWSDGLPTATRHDLALPGNIFRFAHFTDGSSPLIMEVVGEGTVIPVVHPDDKKAGHQVQLNTPLAIAATPAQGWRFVGWTATANATIAQPSSAATTTILAANTTVTATFAEGPSTRYQLTVANGSGSGEYAAADVVGIAANAPPKGQVFVAWIGDVDHLADADASSTTVTMPAAPVAVTATYRRIHNVTFDLDGTVCRMTWDSEPGAAYTIESSTDLVTWSALVPHTPSQGESTTAWVDLKQTAHYGAPRLFMRARRH